MKPPAPALRRAALALALAATAALGMTAASAATGRPAAPRPATPACHTSQLRVWIGLPGDGAAGSTYYELQLSNVSSTPCSLFGFPGVSAINSHGTRLGKAAGRDHTFAATTQVLAPRVTVHAVLRITDPGVIGCPTATATELKVFPPNTTAAALVPFKFSACTGANRNLTIRVVRHGAGIPGYSQ
jgi:Domain of unknown function (DUF4232)